MAFAAIVAVWIFVAVATQNAHWFLNVRSKVEDWREYNEECPQARSGKEPTDNVAQS